MATLAMVPLEEYLRTSYEHDCEWVDGEIKERGVPDEYHAYFQSWFLKFFDRPGFGLRGLTELRLQVSESGYRIPDVLAVHAEAKLLPRLSSVPLVCVEILSLDDRVKDLLEKVDDYVAMGVGAIWIVEPRRRVMQVADAAGLHNVTAFQLEGTQVAISAAELFAELDGLENQKA